MDCKEEVTGSNKSEGMLYSYWYGSHIYILKKRRKIKEYENDKQLNIGITQFRQ
jgi:hypothetical protein